MNHDKKTTKELEIVTGPTDTIEKMILEKEMSFSYRQAIGEILFSATTFRPEMLHSIIKVSQYNTKSACVHYIAAKRVLNYLRDAMCDGIHYWCSEINTHLQDIPVPIL